MLKVHVANITDHTLLLKDLNTTGGYDQKLQRSDWIDLVARLFQF